jgi:uncharacterized protein (DUF1800 family)
MTARWLATDGDIREVLRTLLYSPEFRSSAAATAKFKTPYQFVVSAARASGVPVVNVQPIVGTLAQLGMPLYGCQTPDGYKNTEAAWLNPEGVTRRINFASALGSGRLALDRPAPAATGSTPAVAQPAARVAALLPVPLLETLGPTIGDKTRGVVLGSEPQLAAALVLGSPDFMRR